MVEARYSHAGTCFAAEGSFPGLVKSPPAISGERSTETPRNPEDAVVKVWHVPPMSPAQHKRTKSRAGHLAHRTNSLTESKASFVWSGIGGNGRSIIVYLFFDQWLLWLSLGCLGRTKAAVLAST